MGRKLPKRVLVPFIRGVKHNYSDGTKSVKEAAKLLLKRTRDGAKTYTCELNDAEFGWLHSWYIGRMVPRREIREAIEARMMRIALKKDINATRVRLNATKNGEKLILTVTLFT